MKNAQMYFPVIFVLGLALGMSVNFYGHQIEDVQMDMHSDHEHGMVEVSEELEVPSVDLIVTEDPVSGWNLQIVYENFSVVPEDASKEHVDGQGHAHLFIDGKKVTRLYGEWFHIPSDWLEMGEHEVMVNLSSNDHNDYVVDGEMIMDMEVIVVD